MLWHPPTDTVLVCVFDSTNLTAFEFLLEAREALDAFHHPFAYASFRGLRDDAPLSTHDEQPIAL